MYRAPLNCAFVASLLGHIRICRSNLKQLPTTIAFGIRTPRRAGRSGMTGAQNWALYKKSPLPRHTGRAPRKGRPSSHGAPRGIRTPDLGIRSPLLYPTELLARLLCWPILARLHHERTEAANSADITVFASWIMPALTAATTSSNGTQHTATNSSGSGEAGCWLTPSA